MRALSSVDYSKVRVVILGQDPYHGASPDGVPQALGLSFAVPNDFKPKPPSLRNIFKELRSDLGCEIDMSESDLTGWADQGVLLLNTLLTVRAGEAFSHEGRGWEIFTDRIIELLALREEPIVFVLWGAAAQKKKAEILRASESRHFIIESAHPSPLSASRGFLGSRPFSTTNQFLTDKLGVAPIDWTQVSVSHGR